MIHQGLCRLEDIYYVRRSLCHDPTEDTRRYYFFYSVNSAVPITLNGQPMRLRRRQSLLMREDCALVIDADGFAKGTQLFAAVLEVAPMKAPDWTAGGDQGAFLEQLRAKIAPFLIIEETNLIYALLIQILNERHMLTRQHAQVCSSLFVVILYYLNEKLRQGVPTAAELSKQIYNYIAENYTQEISETEASRALGIGTSYLQKLMRQHHHTTFCRLVNDMRVERAKTLLRETAQPVAAIGYSCGFNSRQRFNLVFRRLTGETPTQYRKAQKSSSEGASQT